CSGHCQKELDDDDTTCSEHCFAEGSPCKEAYDCCSLGCWNGVCGAPMCRIFGDPCTSNTDCCSHACIDGACADNTAKGCRIAGDSCGADGGISACCYGCDPLTRRCKP